MNHTTPAFALFLSALLFALFPIGSHAEESPHTVKSAAAYLGVSTTKVDPVIASHLALRKGIGLVVHAVATNSAAQSSIKPHDILLKLEDQWLVTPEQLEVLISTYAPGDTVGIELVRTGAVLRVSLPLSIRPPLAAATDQDKAALIRSLLAPKHLHALQLDFENIEEGSDIAAQALNLIQEQGVTGSTNSARSFAFSMGGSLVSTNTPSILKAASGNFQSNRSYTMMKNGLSISMTETNGHRYLTARDNKGSTLFDGPINTEEEQKGIPPLVLENLPAFERAVRSTSPR